jgi:hypothetical protein
MVGIKSIGQSKIQGFSEWRVWKFGGNTWHKHSLHFIPKVIWMIGSIYENLCRER